MSKETGTLTLSTSMSRPLVLAVGDNIKILITREKARIKVVIEAPKDVNIHRLIEIEKGFASFVSNELDAIEN